jgi:DeoR/GlpR family transcriptional regulator of sugar metabolism
MLKEERFQAILSSLQKDHRVLLPELSKQLKVSEDTVRRDIKELSAQKLLREVRGGAVPHAPGPHNLKERSAFASRQKQAMAKKAIKLIHPGQVIILDSGTSTLAVASMIPADMKLTVITNCFPIVNMLQDHKSVDIFFAGGKLHRDSLITTGTDAVNFYKDFHADICFLGICSIDQELGLTALSHEEAAVKKVMIKAAGQVIALTTPEKINTAEPFHICPVGALSGMITPSPDIEILKPYKQAGIKVM